jgi:hypothetical protein
MDDISHILEKLCEQKWSRCSLKKITDSFSFIGNIFGLFGDALDAIYDSNNHNQNNYAEQKEESEDRS